ncbi:hypothetical protein GG851_02535 [Bordetella petrii]|nr:hypothetical protein [Bordetella petrii]
MQKSDSPPDGMPLDIVQRLNALQHVEQRARLRCLMPLIDELVRAGVSHAAIVATLATDGIALTPNAVRQALYRWRKRHQVQAVRPLAPTPTSGLATLAPPPARPHVAAGGGITSKADLVRLRTSNEIDLNALAEIGRQK